MIVKLSIPIWRISTCMEISDENAVYQRPKMGLILFIYKKIMTVSDFIKHKYICHAF